MNKTKADSLLIRRVCFLAEIWNKSIRKWKNSIEKCD
jgi:hypothetical protein